MKTDFQLPVIWNLPAKDALSDVALLPFNDSPPVTVEFLEEKQKRFRPSLLPVGSLRHLSRLSQLSINHTACPGSLQYDMPQFKSILVRGADGKLHLVSIHRLFLSNVWKGVVLGKYSIVASRQLSCSHELPDPMSELLHTERGNVEIDFLPLFLFASIVAVVRGSKFIDLETQSGTRKTFLVNLLCLLFQSPFLLPPLYMLFPLYLLLCLLHELPCPSLVRVG